MTALGFFPDLAPGELLYGALARLATELPGGAGAALATRSLGRKAGAPAADMPSGLRRLAAALPARSGVTARSLLVGNTLFPYYARFVEPDVSGRLEASLLEGRRGPPRAGALANRLPAPGRLRACRDCMREHRESLGEPRWLALHQMPGVLVCAGHGTPLLETAVRMSVLPSGPGCVPLDFGLLPASSVARVPDFRLAMRMALASRELLEAPLLPDGAAVASRALRGMLGRYAWARAPSLLASTELVGDLLAHRGFRGVLSLAGASLDAPVSVATALRRALRAEAPSMHPVLALALVEFAGGRAADLLGAPGTLMAATMAAPPTKAPLPCGNPVCGRWRGDPALSGRMPDVPARHTCAECGFAYRWDPRGRSKITLIRTGSLFDAELARLVAEPSVSLREMSRRLRVSPLALSRRARVLGLSREGWSEAPRFHPRAAALAARMLFRHRRVWLAFRRAGGVGPAKAFPAAVRNAYRFLLRHDAGWLAENRPLVGYRRQSAGQGRARGEEVRG